MDDFHFHLRRFPQRILYFYVCVNVMVLYVQVIFRLKHLQDLRSHGAAVAHSSLKQYLLITSDREANTYLEGLVSVAICRW